MTRSTPTTVDVFCSPFDVEVLNRNLIEPPALVRSGPPDPEFTSL